MASAIIHLCIAKKVNEILKRNEKEFFLGNIAPDISKQIGENKTKSHFLDGGGRDIPNLNAFLKKYQKSLKDNAFNLGYYCHLFTDMIWFGMFINNFCNLEETEIKYCYGQVKELTKDSVIKILYNDYTNLNIKAIDKYALDLSLFYEKAPNIESEINEIPIDKLSIIVDKMGIIIENSKERKNIVFNPTTIFRFIDKTAEDFIFNLKEIGVIDEC